MLAAAIVSLAFSNQEPTCAQIKEVHSDKDPDGVSCCTNPDGKASMVDLIHKVRGNWSETNMFKTYLFDNYPVKCFVNKLEAKDTVIYLTGSGASSGGVFGLFNAYATVQPTSTNLCEILGDISLQSQAETYVALGLLSAPEVITGTPYYGATRRAPGFNMTSLQGAIISTMNALEHDGFAIPNRYSVMGFSSGTSNWLAAAIQSTEIVARSIAFGANIGSLPGTFNTTDLHPLISQYVNGGYTDEAHEKFLAMDFSHIHWRMYYGDNDQFFGTEAGGYQALLAMGIPGLKSALEYTKDALVSKLSCDPVPVKTSAESLTAELEVELSTFECSGAASFKTFVYLNSENWPGTDTGQFAGYPIRASHLPLYPAPRKNSLQQDFDSGYHTISYLPAFINDYIEYSTS